jgi:hypothetical protein
MTDAHKPARFVGMGRVVLHFRKLPVTEWTQGFPEDFRFVGLYKKAWKFIGQAIPIYVGRAILESIVAEARASGRLAPAATAAGVSA